MDATAADPQTSTAHPLDPLTAAELARAVEAMRDDGALAEGVRVISVDLHEPDKAALLEWRNGGGRPPREAIAVLFDSRNVTAAELVVSIADGRVSSRTDLEGQQPAVSMAEYLEAGDVCRRDPDFRAALARRGIEGDNADLVHVEPWTVGAFEGRERRVARCLAWMRRDLDDVNPYARPIAGLVGVVDLAEMRVLRVDDHGPLPVPGHDADYRNGGGAGFRADLRPIEITQPDGPSFVLEGNHMRWQKWDLRIGFSHRESLVLHEIGYRDGDRLRPICHRASIAELVIPYGDPNPTVHFKNVFDTGEYGMGPLVNALELGCDCVGEIRTWTPPASTARHSRDHAAERDLHPRGGLRHPLEASRRQHRPDRRRTIAPAGDLLHRHRRQLRVRLLLVPLSGRHDPVRGQADRHRARPAGVPEGQPAPRHAGRARRGGRLPPALPHRPARHRR